MFLVLLAGLPAQGLVFQNQFRQGGHVLTDDLVLSQSMYVNRGRALVGESGNWWAKSGTLAQIRPDSWLSNGWVWQNGRAYIGDYWFLVKPGESILTIQNESTARDLRVRSDDTAPELAVLLSPAGVVETNAAKSESGNPALVFADGAKIHLAAHDGGSGLDGIYWSTTGRGKPYLAPFTPDASAATIEFLARDRVGNEVSRKFDLVRDNEAPDPLVRILSPESNWQMAAADLVEFQAPPLELAIIARDHRDPKPSVFASLDGVARFKPLREVMKLPASAVVYYYAVDGAGNLSAVWRLRAVLREPLPLLQAK
ncbi:MAG: hypothetical protein J0L75_08180 [Spirochaetes bacterium]|nr:hypothetical protein [Spirochaetota bacterium]